MVATSSVRKTLRGSLTGVAAAAGWLIAGAAHAASGEDAQVVELTQIGCQFVESENGVDHGYQPTKADDCKAITAKTSVERLWTAKVLRLKPGEYVFRVTNKNVPYPLGFWLRESDYQLGNPLHKLTKTSVSGGGLALGTTKDYAVNLEPGEYVYSCPLNPTPNYRLIVEG